ncbi:CusA/CzcA family heavy metal efflux RND transporter [Sediminicoccus rosea]|uniref:CusA/CzcA family heavy metal efflux RND transporter n=1 Tax=Sediminicoccus rosea TaxID=1225128 RepID=A0ABZ0PJ05_9PROT|nr:CusA/CzcA family heavy metal efflux RND transporter [Sediminicoccus rosea]WPB85708.1 CusA/CzcA family heavy metal efflux RND transporter [Sediminicoccus rosea]
MLAKLVDTALRQRLLVLIAALGLAVWGFQSYRALPIDAFPDVAPTQVLVSMRAPGLTPEELERRVTNPIELAMRGIPNLVFMRSVTRFSVTLMTFEFAEGTDIYWARAQVNERLNELEDQLPDGVSGGLAPIITPLAEMLMFTLEGGNLSPTEARTLMDWVVRPQLRAVPGVADVNVLGGFVRTYEVVPDPAAMAARGISTAMLEEALERNNRNDGAGRIRDGEEALLVRAEGRIQTLEDVRAIVLLARDAGVVRVGDVADVRFGALPRNGVVTRDGEGEAVWGIVLGLRGANARSVVEGARERFPAIQNALPDGVNLVVFYDRADLIGKAVWTVQKVLLEAIALVVVLLILFLGNWRAALVVSLSLPLAVLVTFGLMHYFGLSANIMSLGGLAIAIGLLVDCAVVVVENAAHRFGMEKLSKLTIAQRIRFTAEATREVMVPLVSGVIIIIAVFVPLLSLQGLEGRLFGPVALTIAFALVAALTLALTVVPVMCAFLLRGGHHQEPWLVRKLHAAYDPFLEWAMARPFRVAATAGVGLVLAGLAFTQIGSIFIPVMDEGTPVVTVRKHPTIGIEEAAETDQRIAREIIARVPEVRGIMTRAGADELGIDPVGLNETDMFFTMAPEAEWRAEAKAGGTPWVLEQVRQVLDGFPGTSFSFSQPIDMRVQEMIIGARGDVVIKVFGPEIPELNRIGREVAEAVRGITGSADVFALRNEGMKYLTVRVDRLAAGRLGLNASDVQEALRVWVDGRNVGQVLEGDRRIPLLLRGEEGLRRSAADLARVQIALPAGGTVLLSQVAEIREEEGAVQVIREQAERFATVLSNVRGRDIGGFVAEAQARVAERVQLPQGYRLVWGGQFENQQRAQARLAIVVPIALGAIFLLLYLTFGSARQATLVFCNVPFALIGGVIALWASGEFISVPASVGFLTLIGIAVLNGVVLISYINRLIAEEGLSLEQAVREGAKRRMTPVVLTAMIAALALVPFLFATGPGSEIQRPLAIVVIGGLVTATSLTLILLPILYERFALPRVKAVAVAAVLAALMLPGAPALAQGQGQGQGQLSRHLEAALALDAGLRALEAQRGAAAARGATARSPIAGSPALGGSLRSGTQGPGQVRELDLELAAPMWLPGQRGALQGTVDGAVNEVESRIALRRLEVAGQLREAWWDAAEARRSAQLARERLSTAREIARDVARRAELGDIPPTEALLARNETLSAELGLAQAEAAAAQAVANYRTLTGGLEPNLPVEATRQAARHPALVSAEAALAHAEARQRLVAATPRDNPELGLFGRQEGGTGMSDTTSLGLRVRIPLGTEARNAPRRAEAESEVTRATAELAQARRLVQAATARAQAELRAADAALAIARQRLAVAREQEAVALRAFRAGETGTFDLFRVRQLRLEAANDEGAASIAASRARSRVNQAAGVVP